MDSRVAFRAFGVDVYWYGVLIAGGLLAAAVWMSRREKRLGLEKDTAIDLLLWTLPAAIIGARAYYVAFSWDMFRGNLGAILDIRSGGLAVFGGIIAGFLCIFIYSRVKKVPLYALLDLAAPSLALGQAVGRWGNFANGEAYGRAVAREWMRFFPFAVHIQEDGLWHYATFFYESAWCLLTAVSLGVAEKKGIIRRRGDVFWWYLALYGAERAFVEGLRTDSLYLFGARVSQLVSAGILCAACGVFAARAIRRKGRRAAAYLAGCACALLSPWCGGGIWTAGLLALALLCAMAAYRHSGQKGGEAA